MTLRKTPDSISVVALIGASVGAFEKLTFPIGFGGGTRRGHGGVTAGARLAPGPGLPGAYNQAMTDADRPATRLERDSMGEMEVPTDALYGASTQRAVLNFPISGEGMPRRFLRALALIKVAAAETNGALGLLDADIAAAIAASADEVAAGAHDNHFPIDIYQTGSGTSTNTNMNEVVAHLASARLAGRTIHPNDEVNRCHQNFVEYS